MDHSLLDDDYAMVQQADISTASSSICAGAGSLDGSEMTTNGGLASAKHARCTSCMTAR